MEHRPSTDISYGGMLPRTSVRPIPGAAPTLPRFRWPSERHLAPSHCANCGARLLVDETPSADHPKVDVACLMCPATACELVADGWRDRLTPEEFRALPVQQPRRPGRPPSTTGTIVTRIVGLLEQHRALSAAAVAEALGISVVQARNAAGDARKRGHRVVCEDGLYMLEGT